MNNCGRIGGDGDLSAHGQEVCSQLPCHSYRTVSK